MGEATTMEREYGDSTLELIGNVLGAGADHAVVLMRHSAREFAPGVHDLENPLTAEGRELALRLGAGLPKGATVRAYASPPARCMDTAALVLEGHRAGGGAVTRHRPVEALGVFYALDQMKMWKAMSAAGGLVPFIGQWMSGTVPADAMMPPAVAAQMVLRIMAARLAEPLAASQIDFCVSHDMTLYLVREALLGEPASGPDVRFLDGIALYRQDRAYWLRSHYGQPVNVTALLA